MAMCVLTRGTGVAGALPALLEALLGRTGLVAVVLMAPLPRDATGDDRALGGTSGLREGEELFIPSAPMPCSKEEVTRPSWLVP